MVTKEQALTCRYFLQVNTYNSDNGRELLAEYPDTFKLGKPHLWRANGKCKTWKTRPDEFKLPIKHGLYSYGYITHENAHLFIVGTYL